MITTQGGIHRYIEQYGSGGFFKGKNFVFDARGLQSPAEVHKQYIRSLQQTSRATSNGQGDRGEGGGCRDIRGDCGSEEQEDGRGKGGGIGRGLKEVGGGVKNVDGAVGGGSAAVVTKGIGEEEGIQDAREVLEKGADKGTSSSFFAAIMAAAAASVAAAAVGPDEEVITQSAIAGAMVGGGHTVGCRGTEGTEENGMGISLSDPTFQQDEVVGTCFDCGSPTEALTGDRVCAVCRDAVLCCEKCRRRRRGVLFCSVHRLGLDGAYFPFLDGFPVKELRRQRTVLLELIDPNAKRERQREERKKKHLKRIAMAQGKECGEEEKGTSSTTSEDAKAQGERQDHLLSSSTPQSESSALISSSPSSSSSSSSSSSLSSSSSSSSSILSSSLRGIYADRRCLRRSLWNQIRRLERRIQFLAQGLPLEQEKEEKRGRKKVTDQHLEESMHPPQICRSCGRALRFETTSPSIVAKAACSGAVNSMDDCDNGPAADGAAFAEEYCHGNCWGFFEHQRRTEGYVDLDAHNEILCQ